MLVHDHQHLLEADANSSLQLIQALAFGLEANTKLSKQC